MKKGLWTVADDVVIGVYYHTSVVDAVVQWLTNYFQLYYLVYSNNVQLYVQFFHNTHIAAVFEIATPVVSYSLTLVIVLMVVD